MTVTDPPEPRYISGPHLCWRLLHCFAKKMFLLSRIGFLWIRLDQFVQMPNQFLSYHTIDCFASPRYS